MAKWLENWPRFAHDAIAPIPGSAESAENQSFDIGQRQSRLRPAQVRALAQQVRSP